MARGPGLDLTNIPFDRPHDASFRLVTSYYVATDSLITQIDVKANGQQFTVGFSSSAPVQPQTGDKILGSDDLLTPGKGVEDCLNVKAPLDQVLSALKELVADIEMHKEEQKLRAKSRMLEYGSAAMGHGYRSGAWCGD
jgi:hypothetical protein